MTLCFVPLRGLIVFAEACKGCGGTGRKAGMKCFRCKGTGRK
jgi:DnaJ-class molecular chaperone